MPDKVVSHDGCGPQTTGRRHNHSRRAARDSCSRAETGCPSSGWNDWVKNIARALSRAHHRQTVRVRNDDQGPRACHEPATFPVAQQPADGVNCGIGHVGDVLAGNRKTDFDAADNLAPGQTNHPQQGAGDALFHKLRGQFDNPSLISSA